MLIWTKAEEIEGRFTHEAECVWKCSINRGRKGGMNGGDFKVPKWGHPTCHTRPTLRQKYLKKKYSIFQFEVEIFVD